MMLKIPANLLLSTKRAATANRAHARARARRWVSEAGAISLVAGTLLLSPITPAAAQEQCAQRFNFTGGAQEFVVPDGITQINVAIAGAAGGDTSGGAGTPGVGGLGALVTGGVIDVAGGDVITVIVGGEGGSAVNDNDSDGDGDNDGGVGGFGYDGTITGGQSGGDGGDATIYHGGGGGGGASAVLDNGVLVASAGGGGGGAHGGNGGDGGATGEDGDVDLDQSGNNPTPDPNAPGGGATNTAGGAGGTGSNRGDDGEDGVQGAGGTGGDALNTPKSDGGGDAGGGGGGGQFGGGGAGGGQATTDGGGAGGGGGSSEVNSGTVTPGQQDGDGFVLLSFEQEECPGDVQIEKSVSDPTPEIGDQITYTLVATNNGPVNPDTGVVVTDNLPPGVDYVSDDCGGVNQDPGDRWTWEIGDLALDDPQECNITVEVRSPGVWTNTAVIRGDLPDSNPDNNESSIDINVPDPVYDLAIEKTATVEDDGQITYTLTGTNLGPDPTHQVVVVGDVLPSQVEYVSDTCDGTVPDPQPPNVDGTAWFVVAGPMAVDEIFTCDITVDVVETGVDITNPAVIGTHDSPSIEPNLDNNEDDATLEPALAITKTAEPSDEVLPGGTVEYTVTVENTGELPYTDADPATFTDDLTGVLDDATFDDNAAADIGTATFTDPNVSWEGALDPGDVATITYSVTVEDPLTGDGVLTNSVVGPPESNCDEGTEEDCTTDVPVRALEIDKTVEPMDEVTPGATISYTVTVTNTGQVAYTDAEPATFTDDLTAVLDDAAWDDTVTIEPDQGTATFTDPNLVWEGPLAPGETVTVTYTLTVDDPPGGDGILTNTVVGPSESNCDEGTEPECSTVVPDRSLEIVKTSEPSDEVLPGGTVAYTVTVTNTGQVAYTEDEPAVFDDDLTDVLDDAAFNDDEDADVGEATFDGEVTLSWSGPLEPGDVATITYSVTVNDPLTGDGVLTNAVVGPPESNCDDGTEEDCTTDVPVRALEIAKTSDPADQALAGGTVTYTVTVENTGQVAYTDDEPAMFTDDLTEVLDDATFNDDADADIGTAVFADPELSWEGALEPGDVATITYSVTVNDPLTGDGVLTNAVVGPDESNCDEGTEPDCTTDLPVRALEIVKTSEPADEVLPGGTVSYTVTVTNIGQTTYTDADPASFDDDLTEVLDDAAFNDDEAADVGAATFTDPTLSWSSDVDEFAPGDVATITYSVTVNDPVSGDGVLTNAVVGPPESNCDEGTEPDCTTDVPVRALEIVKTSSPIVVLPGGTVDYTVTVTNTGQVAYTDAEPATFTDDLTDVLDDATFNDDAAADIGEATFTDPDLSWSGALEPGDVATITYSVTVNDPPTGEGDGELTNAVVGPDESNCDEGTEDDCTTSVPIRELLIDKTVDVEEALPGDVVTYTIEVTNIGDFPFGPVFPARFDDDLTEVLDDASFNDDAEADVGEVTFEEPVLHWESTELFAPGDTATITYSVTVNDPTTGDDVLTNVVTGPPVSNCDPDSDGFPGEECTTDVPVRELEIVKTSEPEDDVLPGGTVSYTVTVENTGQVPYTDADPASFDDDLTEVLDDATFNDDAAADIGTVTFSDPAVSWEGALDPDEVATITYSVTVNDPLTGDGMLTNAVVGPPESNCNPGGEEDCTTDVPIRAFEVVKSLDAGDVVGPGSTITYTVTVANIGQAAYTDDMPASFADDLSDVIDDATFDDDASATAGTVSYSEPVLTWTGPLDVGDTVTVTYDVTVNDPTTGDDTIANVVTPDEGSGGRCLDDDTANCETVTTVEMVEPLVKTGTGLGDVSLIGLGLLFVGSALYITRRRLVVPSG